MREWVAEKENLESVLNFKKEMERKGAKGDFVEGRKSRKSGWI